MNVENSTQNAGVTIAAFMVERAIGGARGSVAGLVVQPVTWAVTGQQPDAGDSFIYGMGAIGAFAGALIAIPAAITGVIKAAVDDHTAALVEEAKADEPEAVRGGIKSVSEFSFWASGGDIESYQIASYGGVSWRHPNGVNLYLEDAAGALVCDYVPRRYAMLYRPNLPLRRNGDRFAWTSRRP